MSSFTRVSQVDSRSGALGSLTSAGSVSVSDRVVLCHCSRRSSALHPGAMCGMNLDLYL